MRVCVCVCGHTNFTLIYFQTFANLTFAFISDFDLEISFSVCVCVKFLEKVTTTTSKRKASLAVILQNSSRHFYTNTIGINTNTHGTGNRVDVKKKFVCEFKFGTSFLSILEMRRFKNVTHSHTLSLSLYITDTHSFDPIKFNVITFIFVCPIWTMDNSVHWLCV